MEITRKYAKDLNPGDKIYDSGKELLFVDNQRRIPNTTKTELILNGETIICDSHIVYDVLTEGN